MNVKGIIKNRSLIIIRVAVKINMNHGIYMRFCLKLRVLMATFVVFVCSKTVGNDSVFCSVDY